MRKVGKMFVTMVLAGVIALGGVTGGVSVMQPIVAQAATVSAIKNLNQYVAGYDSDTPSKFFTCIEMPRALNPEISTFSYTMKGPNGKSYSGKSSTTADAIPIDKLSRNNVYTASVTGVTKDGKKLATQKLKLFADPIQTVNKISKNKIKVTWTKQTGCDGYVVYGSTDGRTFTKIKTLNSAATSYTVTKVNGKAVKTSGTYYIYVASKVVDNGVTRYSYHVSTYSKAPKLTLNTFSKTTSKCVKKVYPSNNCTFK